ETFSSSIKKIKVAYKVPFLASAFNMSFALVMRLLTCIWIFTVPSDFNIPRICKVVTQDIQNYLRRYDCQRDDEYEIIRDDKDDRTSQCKQYSQNYQNVPE